MRKMKHPIGAIAAAALLVAAGTASTARAADICGRYGSTVVGKYVVQNDCWNDSVCGPNVPNPPDPVQCIKAIDQGGGGPGFAVTLQKATAPDKRPVSYPSIYIGCHYGNCSPGTNLPIPVKSIKKAETSISLKYVGGATFDASYDIWLDPTPKKTDVNKQEIMIWLNRKGQIQPVGNPVGNVTIAGQNWQVWSGSNGANDVISYVAPNPIPKMTFNVPDFLADAAKRSKIDGFYLTSIQAGFEPWQGGQGLAIEGFRATVDAP
jgi:hypothetical protein